MRRALPIAIVAGAAFVALRLLAFNNSTDSAAPATTHRVATTTTTTTTTVPPPTTTEPAPDRSCGWGQIEDAHAYGKEWMCSKANEWVLIRRPVAPPPAPRPPAHSSTDVLCSDLEIIYREAKMDSAWIGAVIRTDRAMGSCV